MGKSWANIKNHQKHMEKSGFVGTPFLVFKCLRAIYVEVTEHKIYRNAKMSLNSMTMDYNHFIRATILRDQNRIKTTERGIIHQRT